MGENAAYLVPKTLNGKNIACLLSDRSRALAQAYVLKRQDDILFGRLGKVGRYSFLCFIYKTSGVSFIPS